MDFQKILYVLKALYHKSHKESFEEILSFSEVEFLRHPNTSIPPEWNAYNINIHTQPEIFLKYHDTLKLKADIIKDDLHKISNLKIDRIKFLPDYEKFQIIDSHIQPIYTDWEEINQAQSKLVDALRKGTDSLDFQGIGTISRTIFQKLAGIVFNKNKHTLKDRDLDVSGGKYKNQLLSYIETELSGETNEDLRSFTKSLIDTVLKAVDLANSVTHKIEGERLFAEVCVLGTINAINIIKLIEKKQ